jgi:uncharacterized phage infection (PIP) family protein YhgE
MGAPEVELFASTTGTDAGRALLILIEEIERTWLEVTLLVLRLAVSALLILIGWVTTVGTLSILSKQSRC